MRHGSYEVEEALGRGATATVYCARQIGLDRRVALKVLHRELDEESRLRFRRELKVAIGLAHPGLVRVLDGDPDGPSPYLVMELVEGETLAALLEREGPLSPSRAIEEAARMVEAMEYLHRRSFLHRDLKPGNILMARDGSLKVADFGLARPEIATLLTPVGTIIGTLAYMAPEVLLGEPPSAASDSWAIGVILHEMLTGHGLLEDDSLPRWIERLRSRRIETGRLDSPSIPRPLAAIVRSLIDLEPSARPSLDDVLVDRLRRLAEPEVVTPFTPVRATTAPAPRRGLDRRTAGAVLALLLLGSGIAVLHTARQTGDQRDLLAAEAALEAGRREDAITGFRRFLERHPAHSKAANMASRLLGEAGSTDEALAVVDRAMAAGANDVELKMRKVTFLGKLGRFEEADRFLDAQARPGEMWALLHRALLRIVKGNPGEAERLLREAMAVEPGNRDIRGHLARILFERGAKDEAREHLTVALRPRPPAAWLLQLRGRMEAAEGDPAAGEATFREAIRLDPDSSDLRWSYCVFLMQQGRLQEAEKDVSRLVEKVPRELEYRCTLTMLLLRRGECARSKSEALQILEIQPDHHEALVWLGESILCQARSDLHHAAEFESRVEPRARSKYPLSSSLNALRGRWRALRGEHPLAEKLAREAVKYSPEVLAYQLQLATHLQAQGKLDEARLTCSEAIRLDPTSSVPTRMMAQILEGQENHVEALPWRRKTVELMPREHSGHDQASLAFTLDRLGHEEAALEAYCAAIELGVDQPPVVRRVADMLALRQRFAESAVLYRRLRKQLPDDTDIATRHYLVEAELARIGKEAAPVTGVTTH